MYLFGVELVELHLLAMFAPQTEDLSFGTVRHVHQLLVPPPVTDGPHHTAQDYTVITHLQKGCKKVTDTGQNVNTCSYGSTSKQ